MDLTILHIPGEPIDDANVPLTLDIGVVFAANEDADARRFLNFEAYKKGTKHKYHTYGDDALADYLQGSQIKLRDDYQFHTKDNKLFANRKGTTLDEAHVVHLTVESGAPVGEVVEFHGSYHLGKPTDTSPGDLDALVVLDVTTRDPANPTQPPRRSAYRSKVKCIEHCLSGQPGDCK